MGKQAKKKGYRAPRKNSSASAGKIEEKVKSNPFEVMVNKRKHVTLGRQGREEKGHPGLAKSRGIAKRKRTLQKDYQTKDKTNSLVDRRIGERSKGVPEEAKIVRRSAIEKKKQYTKKSIFNLNDDEEEVLTHKGQSLSLAGRYDDPRESSDSEEERLNESFVGEVNFAGGFLKKKVNKEEEDMGPEEREKTRSQIIAELVLASKEKKFKKSQEDAELYDRIEKLDGVLKEMGVEKVVGSLLGRPQQQPVPQPVPSQSDYDKTLKELVFEKRGQAADRSKSVSNQNEKSDSEKEIKPSLSVLLSVFHETEIKTVKHIKSLLTLCDTLLKIGEPKKSYFPEIYQFLLGFLYSFTKGAEPKMAEYRFIISMSEEPLSVQSSVVAQAMPIFAEFKKSCKHLKSASEILEIIYELFPILNTIPLKGIGTITEDFRGVEELEDKTALIANRKRPKMLRMYEPEINYDNPGSSKKSKTSKEEGWLAAKVKKETKGAIRELKKDNAFLGRLQRQEQAKSDAERNEKVKALMGSLANQEGEYQKLKKKK